jgi:hypothetical protein
VLQSTGSPEELSSIPLSEMGLNVPIESVAPLELEEPVDDPADDPVDVLDPPLELPAVVAEQSGVAHGVVSVIDNSLPDSESEPQPSRTAQSSARRMDARLTRPA